MARPRSCRTNVLEKLRVGEPLTEKERETHGQGLVSVLRELHDALDGAVLAAYGWSDLGPALVGKPGGSAPGQAKAPKQTAAEEELLPREEYLKCGRLEHGFLRVPCEVC